MRSSVRSGLVSILAASTLILLFGNLALASQVRPVNLEEMTERAAKIFSGRCVALVSQFDPDVGRNVTVATFEVDRVVKGQVGSTATVKFLGTLDPAGTTPGPVPGMPRLREDEEVVLFLYGESVLGLTSPVGWGQGKFTVVRDKQGRKIAVNDFGNRNLLRGMSDDGKARLGGSLEQWRGRAAVDKSALLDMVSALRQKAR